MGIFLRKVLKLELGLVTLENMKENNEDMEYKLKNMQ